MMIDSWEIMICFPRLTFQGYVTDPRSFTPEQFGANGFCEWFCE